MPVYGCTITHTTPADGPRENRWWVLADTLNDALDEGQNIVQIVKPIFNSTLHFTKIHVWVPNSTPNNFRNRTISMPGETLSSTPTSAVPVIQFLATSNSAAYPTSKNFRVCLDPGFQTGRLWGATIVAEIADVLTALNNQTTITTESGAVLSDWSLNPEVEYRQLSKRWYNRAT